MTAMFTPRWKKLLGTPQNVTDKTDRSPFVSFVSFVSTDFERSQEKSPRGADGVLFVREAVAVEIAVVRCGVEVAVPNERGMRRRDNLGGVGVIRQVS